MKELLQQSFYNNTIQNYLIFAAILVLGMLAVRILKSIVIHRLKEWAKKTATTIDDFLIQNIDKKLIPLLYFAVLFFAAKSLILTPATTRIIDVLAVILITFIGIRFLILLFSYVLEAHWLKKETDESRKRDVKGLMPVIKVVIWIVGLIFLLDNLGFEINTVIAGLGIGGIAVALAAQAVLGDLFSYFSILFDRPFELGDFIIIGDYMGTIEHIGIKTTRVRSLGGEQLVFSNTDLTNSRVRNYKRMEKRRIVFKLGVTYQTPNQKLKEIPGIILDIIKNIENTVFDRAHFSSYGDFSLIFEVVYYVLSSDYNKYMDIQQDINFAINEEFEKRGIEFAYPTQTLFLEKNAENS